MISPSLSFARTLVFEARKRRQYVNRRTITAVVKVTRQDNLTFGDVACQIRNGVSDVILRHGENRNLRHRAFLPHQAPRPFIKGGKIGIEIARITSTSRHFSTSCGYFAQGLAVVGHICHDDENMHVFFISQIFSSSQGNPRCRNPLNSRIIG